MEVKLTGIVTTIALSPGELPTHATRITAELAAPNHQHLFCARLDVDLDGTDNSVYEVDVTADAAGAANPYGNAFTAHATRLDTEQAAQRAVDPSRSRVWKVVNPNVRNAAGDPVGYKLVPGQTPALLASPESSIGRRAGFATRTLCGPRHAPARRCAAGASPNHSPGA